MSRVSVIIAAYNAEPFIGTALKSVAGQTYDDWEVVLADDCSTDRTAEIAAGFGPPITVVRTPRNSGPAVARNLAVSHAQGELLAPLDADDYWLPEFLERQVRLFDESRSRGRNTGIVACDAQLLAPDGTIASRTYMDDVRAPAELDLTQLLKANPIFVSALVPKKAYEEVGGEFAEVTPAEDWDLWIRLLERGYEIVVNRMPLAVYRVTPGSLSSDRTVLARAAQRIYLRALERGHLTPKQQRIARRELRLQRATVSLDEFARRRREGRRAAVGGIARNLPLVALAVAEHPRRWPSYARAVLGIEQSSPLSRTAPS